jgi:uncharacterized membrane protein YeaQ/YmgE (transglycosylase-associated protein family)
MSFLWMLVIGLTIGAIFKVVVSGRNSGNLTDALIVAITGSVLAGGLGWAERWYDPGEPVGFIACAIGAVSLLALFRVTMRRETPEHQDIRRAA